MKRIAFQIFISFLAILAVQAQDYSDYTGCVEQDSLALVAFFNATDGSNWTSQQDGFNVDNLSENVKTYHTIDYPNAGMGKWLEGPVKDWFGVLLAKRPVGNTTDSVWRVIHLRPTISRRSAGDNNLKGVVPKEVGLLTALEWFKVNGNIGLEGQIPDEIYHESLRKFDIEAAYFSGIITEAYRNCINLDYINLRYNHIDSMPALDFLTREHLLNTFAASAQPIWFYDTQISYAAIEPTVRYFRSVSENIVYEARNITDMGRKQEIILTPGGNVSFSTSEGGESGEYTWYKNGFNTFITGDTYTATDTGLYKALVVNEYIRQFDDNKDWVSAYTKPVHVVYEPVTPVCNSINTSYSGQNITLEFTKPMAVPQSAQASQFSVTEGGNIINVVGISRIGRLRDKLVLKLETPISKDAAVLVSYTAGDVVCENGGALESFTDFETKNLTREKPSITGAITAISGESIILTFDKYIDENSFNNTDFVINIEGEGEIAVDEVLLVGGVYNENISKKIELILDGIVDGEQVITVSYNQGSLTGLYGGSLDSFENYSVENVAVAVRVEFLLTVVDGTEGIDHIVVKSDMTSKPIELYDDGTNGDVTSGDHIWSVALSVTPGEYEWEVYSRTLVYDTIVNGDTIKIIPNKDASIDDLISTNALLNVSLNVDNIDGDTQYEYYNNTITFILDLTNYLNANSGLSAEPYLMGISDDWNEGIAMEVLGDDNPNKFVAQVFKQNSGDELEFAFRNGSIWENSSPAVRTHTIAGNDTIYISFADFSTNVEFSANQQQVKIYPNPVNTYLNFDAGTYKVKEVKIYSLIGECVSIQKGNMDGIYVSKLKSGIFFIEITTEQGKTKRQQFIKF